VKLVFTRPGGRLTWPESDVDQLDGREIVLSHRHVDELFAADLTIRRIRALHLHMGALVLPIFAAGIAAAMAGYGAGLGKLPLAVNLGRLAMGVGDGRTAFLLIEQVWPACAMLAFASATYGIATIVFASSRFRPPADVAAARCDLLL